jgi:hypothetical protein
MNRGEEEGEVDRERERARERETGGQQLERERCSKQLVGMLVARGLAARGRRRKEGADLVQQLVCILDDVHLQLVKVSPKVGRRGDSLGDLQLLCKHLRNVVVFCVPSVPSL